MHFTNNNEMNSNTIASAEWKAKPIAAHPTVFNATSARGSETIKLSTSSADSCASSTDSGVIITDNNRTCSNDSNNYKNIQGNVSFNTNTNGVDINGTSGNTAKDNSNNIDNSVDDKRRRSAETPKSNNNITINKKIDNNCINIENIINVRRQRNSSSGSSRKSSKNCSPAVSIRSNTISIISIDENAIDSSVVDSDSDFEGQNSSYVVKKLGQQTTYEPNNPNLPNINKGMQVLSQTISPGAIPPTSGPLSETILNGGALSPPMLAPPMAPNSAQIGSIALSNSTDVTFGDKHFYEGPVTIQQFLIDSRDKWKNGEEGGSDNPNFTADDKVSDPENATKSTQPDAPYKFIFSRRAVIITGSIILLTILIGIVIATVNSLTKQTIRKIPSEKSDYVFNGTLLIVTKDEWFAEPVKDDIEKLKLPVPRVIIAHTASTTCENKLQCDARVQSVQAFHMHSNGWSDVGYNFLVGGNGLVYEGRGWYELGAHTKGYNRQSIGIAFIGTFNEEVPTDNDLKAAKLLIEEGVRLGAIAQDYRLYGARQLGGTESPGKALYSIITQWSHWSNRI
ncbi:PREDICTED: peptidoglycan-recognition protein LC isoform X3 [Rhagoletis zephyria]|uniref:peptidoglycan-recognition protein LC isoform X3 n=1 Tax=Rhagoletis zephyria TaxID=28612 RepID=UPI0008119945|nr:PREDICTED: peptidoglycan-recognition protein LC isoform X3 [Rhagoletis zephyria]